MAELKPTYGNFYVKGKVTGLSGGKAFTSGEKNSNEWNRISFGVKVSDSAFVYVELLGSKTNTVRFCRFDNKTKKFDINDFIDIPFSEASTYNKSNYKLYMPIKLGFDTYQELSLTPFDAVNYMNEHLQDGDMVFVTGSLQITKYNDKPQEKFIIKKIYKTEQTDFSETQAFFEQEIVYMGIEVDFDRLVVKSNIIYKQDGQMNFTPYNFVLADNKSKTEVVNVFQSDIPIGSTLKVYGDIVHGVKLTTLEDGTRCIEGVTKELQITGGNLTSLVKSKYKSDDFNDVMNEFIFEDSSANNLNVDDVLGF